ncbi:transcriptional regulator [Pseudoclavibacter endophyticus]|nr:transcriptional regulator [Pseudoclavibacter endophyticus]
MPTAVNETRLQSRLAEIGATGCEMRVVAVLDEQGPIPQVGIAGLADIDRADLSTTLDRLEAGGYVTREPDPDDGRRKLVTLTEDGRARAAQLATVVAAVQAAVLAPLTDHEREQFVSLLRRLQPGADDP